MNYTKNININMYFLHTNSNEIIDGSNVVNQIAIKRSIIGTSYAKPNGELYFRIAIIPASSPFRTYNYLDDVIIVHNKIIVSDRYYIYNAGTIIKFKSTSLKLKGNYIDNADRYGGISFLTRIKKMNFPMGLEYSGFSLTHPSETGNIDILKWWFNSGLELKYGTKALELASTNGHINILELWKNSGLELKYDQHALDYASGSGQVSVLEWWKNSGLKLKYSQWALYLASAGGHINVLEWWFNSGLTLKYFEDVLDWASKNKNINVTEWWKKSGLPLNLNFFKPKVPLCIPDNQFGNQIDNQFGNQICKYAVYSLYHTSLITYTSKFISDPPNQFGRKKGHKWKTEITPTPSQVPKNIVENTDTDTDKSKKRCLDKCVIL
jgi:ankyrin repeat protein